DSMGNIKGIPPGDVQRMSAGTGVTHSEFNHAKDQTTHFLQIWIEPNVTEIPPSYEQKSIPLSEKQNKLCLIASPDGLGNAVKIHADARVYAGLFDGHQSQKLDLDIQRKAYVHLIRGSLHVNDTLLSSGDALLIENESSLLIGDGKDTEVLVFDLSS
ncbi:MAG: pirin family protein, partial [Rhodoferax sp.]|nr:pirin family protein [Rhodoferax sp.]